MSVPITLSDDESLALALQWATEELVYREITDIQYIAPLRITAPAHGVPDGWSVRLDFGGCMGDTLRGKSFPATLIDPDTLEINAVNGAALPHHWGEAHHSKRYLVYNRPVDLTGVAVTGRLRERTDGRPLLTLSSGQLSVDVAAHSIRVNVSPDDLKAVVVPQHPGHRPPCPVRRFVLDIDAIDAAGTHIQLYEVGVTRGWG
jgi:hypothetical protein